MRDHFELFKFLTNQQLSFSAVDAELVVPELPGIYCIMINDISQLPKPYSDILKARDYNVLYIGQASKSLIQRFVREELRHQKSATFFRSIGAVLGYRPIEGSLKNKANKKNYKFSYIDRMEIINWINTNLSINWKVINNYYEIDELEELLIRNYSPLLNLRYNPKKLVELERLREECIMIANR